MNPVAKSNPVGEQVAEAVLAAALTLPLIFAAAELRNSRLLRDTAPASRRAESSPALHSTRQPKLTVASPPPILARRNGHGLRAASESGAEADNREIPNTQASVKGTDPVPGNGAKARASDLEDAAEQHVIGDGARKGGQGE